MGVLIDNQQQHQKINLKSLEKTAQDILNALECPEGELSILLVDDDRIAPLNQTYLLRNGPTNVIAFPMQEGEFGQINPQLLGDVVISLQTAQREAEEGGTRFENRFTELLVHGILHLFGYDHETDEAEAARMEAKSQEILKQIAAKG